MSSYSEKAILETKIQQERMRINILCNQIDYIIKELKEIKQKLKEQEQDK